MIRLFCGYDPREAIGFHVFSSSVLRWASQAVAIAPIGVLGGEGSNAFTKARFLVPALCGFQGRALFMDGSDMLMQADLSELWAKFDPRYAVQVVKHDYRTRHPVKYVGTSMECKNFDYPRKNWASVMLMNCAHPAWGGLDFTRVKNTPARDLLTFAGIADDYIGDLPGEWNRLVDEGQSVMDAKVLHWTAGVPAMVHYADAPGAALWKMERRAMECVE